MKNNNYDTEKKLLQSQKTYNKLHEVTDPDLMGFDGKEGIDDED